MSFRLIVQVTVPALICGAVAAMPGYFSPAWGNFMGAAIVAAGGLFGCLHVSKAVSDHFVPISWALVVIGGFVIAGASLQAAMTS